MIRWRQRDCGALVRRLLYFHIQRAFVSGRAFSFGRAPKPNEFQHSGNSAPATQLFCVAGIAIASLIRRISCAPLVPVCLRIFRSKSILPHARRRWSFIRSRAGGNGMRGRLQCACRVLRALLRGRQQDEMSLHIRHVIHLHRMPMLRSHPFLKRLLPIGISLENHGTASSSI